MVVNRLDRAVKNIEDMRFELVSWAFGQKAGCVGGSWWTRNYLNVFFYGLFLGFLIVCWVFKWFLMVRILAVLLVLQLLRVVYKWLCKAWIMFKIWNRMRKSLKALSGLKRE